MWDFKIQICRHREQNSDYQGQGMRGKKWGGYRSEDTKLQICRMNTKSRDVSYNMRTKGNKIALYIVFMLNESILATFAIKTKNG